MNMTCPNNRITMLNQYSLNCIIYYLQAADRAVLGHSARIFQELQAFEPERLYRANTRAAMQMQQAFIKLCTIDHTECPSACDQVVHFIQMCGNMPLIEGCKRLTCSSCAHFIVIRFGTGFRHCREHDSRDYGTPVRERFLGSGGEFAQMNAYGPFNPYRAHCPACVVAFFGYKYFTDNSIARTVGFSELLMAGAGARCDIDYITKLLQTDRPRNGYDAIVQCIHNAIKYSGLDSSIQFIHELVKLGTMGLHSVHITEDMIAASMQNI